jgi:hypothetical protein
LGSGEPKVINDEGELVSPAMSSTSKIGSVGEPSPQDAPVADQKAKQPIVLIKPPKKIADMTPDKRREFASKIWRVGHGTRKSHTLEDYAGEIGLDMRRSARAWPKKVRRITISWSVHSELASYDDRARRWRNESQANHP